MAALSLRSLHASNLSNSQIIVSSQGVIQWASIHGGRKQRTLFKEAGLAMERKKRRGRKTAIIVANYSSEDSTGREPHHETLASGHRDDSLSEARNGDVTKNKDFHAEAEIGGGNGEDSNNGKFGGGNGDSRQNGDDQNDPNDDNDDDDDDDDDDNFGALLNAEEVNRQSKARGILLPSDMLETAVAIGLPSRILNRYFELQGAAWPLGAAVQGSKQLRNRMLADQRFLFKLLTEIAIDASCATFAEVQKRGKDFWNEFELFMADLLVGVAVDIALVCMLAPFVRLGKTVPAHGSMAKISHAIQALPSSVFEAESPGRRFTLQQRVGTYFYKSAQYGAVGFFCGIIGQGIANSIMIMKRKLKKSEEHDVPVPPLVQSAALWGAFLAISSNTRYQIINGLERVVEGSVVARKMPPVAMTFTVGIRFANNIYGGMQFVDWARWAGVQ